MYFCDTYREGATSYAQWLYGRPCDLRNGLCCDHCQEQTYALPCAMQVTVLVVLAVTNSAGSLGAVTELSRYLQYLAVVIMAVVLVIVIICSNSSSNG